MENGDSLAGHTTSGVHAIDRATCISTVDCEPHPADGQTGWRCLAELCGPAGAPPEAEATRDAFNKASLALLLVQVQGQAGTLRAVATHLWAVRQSEQ